MKQQQQQASKRVSGRKSTRYIGGGEYTGVATEALAVVVVELVDADARIAAGIADALVDVDRALRPRPAGLAHAVVAQRLSAAETL